MGDQSSTDGSWTHYFLEIFKWKSSQEDGMILFLE